MIRKQFDSDSLEEVKRAIIDAGRNKGIKGKFAVNIMEGYSLTDKNKIIKKTDDLSLLDTLVSREEEDTIAFEVLIYNNKSNHACDKYLLITDYETYKEVKQMGRVKSPLNGVSVDTAEVDKLKDKIRDLHTQKATTAIEMQYLKKELDSTTTKLTAEEKKVSELEHKLKGVDMVKSLSMMGKMINGGQVEQEEEAKPLSGVNYTTEQKEFLELAKMAVESLEGQEQTNVIAVMTLLIADPEKAIECKNVFE